VNRHRLAPRDRLALRDQVHELRSVAARLLSLSAAPQDELVPGPLGHNAFGYGRGFVENESSRFREFEFANRFTFSLIAGGAALSL
jgi:hypothetical protein